MTPSLNLDALTPTARYVIHLADNALILGHRLSEWCGHGPALEQDIALSNLSLDLIGQARLYYQYAAKLVGDGHTEDTIAYLRSEREYLNLLLCEQPNGDFAHTIVRQFFYDVYHIELLHGLVNSADANIAAIAKKAIKETDYHLHYSHSWVLRLGDGTKESHHRMKKAIEYMTPYIGECYEQGLDWEKQVIHEGIAPNLADSRPGAVSTITSTLSEATLPFEMSAYDQRGGKEGLHTEHLGHILSDLQHLQRAYPGLDW